ncbi:MAG: hypothetical protein GY862_21520 [Gammaproteobacteria bacterium]|nr:hypothetical protein [Gammaproteobacteria bacterium]
MNNMFILRFFCVGILVFLMLFTGSCRQSQPVLPHSAAKDHKKTVLIVNSDKSLEKYAVVQREFKSELSELNVKTIEINLAKGVSSARLLQKKLAGIRPHLVYTIGSKAYTLTSAEIKNNSLIFSSMINWRRFGIGPNTYGVALELPTEMQLFMYSYIFPEIRTLGVLYSKRHNSQWFEHAALQAKEVGLSLHEIAIKKQSEISPALKKLLPKVDALWLISDPVVLHNTDLVQQIFTTAAARQKPVFAYNTLFSQYGAMLTISADIPTMGRQAAAVAQNLLEQRRIDDEDRVQFPAGSHVTLNLKKVHEYGIKLNHAALSSVENIIE